VIGEPTPDAARHSLTRLNLRLADGHLAVTANGRPTDDGRGAQVSFAVPENPTLTALIADAVESAA
jgi:hypothetical protein